MIWAFLIYWFILFVVSFVMVDYGHRYLYDEPPKMMIVRVAVGSMIMAASLTWTHSSFDTMFTSDIKWTFLLALIWVGVFVLGYAFQPLHGLGFGVVSVLLAAGIATMAVDTMTRPTPQETTRTVAPPTAPIRRSSGPGAGAPKPAK